MGSLQLLLSALVVATVCQALPFKGIKEVNKINVDQQLHPNKDVHDFAGVLVRRGQSSKTEGYVFGTNVMEPTRDRIARIINKVIMTPKKLYKDKTSNRQTKDIPTQFGSGRRAAKDKAARAEKEVIKVHQLNIGAARREISANTEYPSFFRPTAILKTSTYKFPFPKPATNPFDYYRVEPSAPPDLCIPHCLDFVKRGDVPQGRTPYEYYSTPTSKAPRTSIKQIKDNIKHKGNNLLTNIKNNYCKGVRGDEDLIVPIRKGLKKLKHRLRALAEKGHKLVAKVDEKLNKKKASKVVTKEQEKKSKQKQPLHSSSSSPAAHFDQYAPSAPYMSSPPRSGPSLPARPSHV